MNKTLMELIESYSWVKEEVKKQGEEIKVLKNEYEKLLESLKTETYARTKAETLVKVLQDTIEAKDVIE